MQVWRQVTGYTFTRSVGAVCHIASVERMETSQTAQEIFSGHNFKPESPQSGSYRSTDPVRGRKLQLFRH